jgi:hypothetical protein
LSHRTLDAEFNAESKYQVEIRRQSNLKPRRTDFTSNSLSYQKLLGLLFGLANFAGEVPKQKLREQLVLSKFHFLI